MSLQFSGDFSELKEKLVDLDGEWDESGTNRKVLRLNDGVMNWNHSSGKISFQGKRDGRLLLENQVPQLLRIAEESSPMQQRIKDLVTQICAGMYEREEIVAVALLGALCGQNTFLYGPPGTAKSLISRRIACAFREPAYFEYLMNRFSTPEEVFGPVSIKELKEDRYTRKTNNYLPTAEFAFLDEIWKSSPAILNTLLTLINERTFRNGETVEEVPLKALIAASNETPSENQGLDALYDRFILRMMVGPIGKTENFEKLLSSKPSIASISIDPNLQVMSDEWIQWRDQLHEVRLSKETVTIIHLIREALTENYDDLKVYVSDRRWQRAAVLMKASAFFNGRKETNHSDAILLQHCLWTDEDNRQSVVDIVEKAIKECGLSSDVNIADLDREKESLDKEINKEIFYSSDIYETKTLGGKEYFFCVATFNNSYGQKEKKSLYIPSIRMKDEDYFVPVDEKGNEIDSLGCQFDKQGSCCVTYKDYYNSEDYNFKPKILFHRGDKKQDINSRLISSLTESVRNIRGNLNLALEKIETQLSKCKKELDSPFVTSNQAQVAVDGIVVQIRSIKLRIKDCERLEELCR